MAKTLDTLQRLYWIASRLESAGDSGFDPMDIAATIQAARTIERNSAKLSRIAEQECNGIERWDSSARRMLASWTDADQARADKAREKAQGAIFAAFESIYTGRGAAFVVTFQNDPRGAPVRFYIGKADDSRSPDAHF